MICMYDLRSNIDSLQLLDIKPLLIFDMYTGNGKKKKNYKNKE